MLQRSSRSREIAWACGLFAMLWLVGLAVAWRAIHAFFIGDDISDIYAAVYEGDSWLHCLAPKSNGFWRPNYLLLARTIVGLFGLCPLAFHLAGVTLHAAAGTSLFVFSRRVIGLDRAAALVCSVLFMIHPGGWATPLVYQNFGDIMLTIFILIGLIFWHGYLRRSGRARLAVVAAAFLLALASKETAVVFPLILALWAWAEIGGEGNGRNEVAKILSRSALPPLLTFACISLIFGAWSGYNISASEQSYFGEGLAQGSLTLDPVNWIRQMIDYLTSTAVPYLHILEMPVRPLGFSHPVLWGIRGGAGIALLVAVIVLARRGRRVELAAMGSAFLLLALPSLRSGPPMSHYLYSTLAFTLIGIGAAVRLLPANLKMPLRAAAAVWGIFLAAGYAFSPDIGRHVSTTEKVERLAMSTLEVGEDWPPGQRVVIYHHPHPGEPGLRWIYGQLLLWIYFPETLPELIMPEDGSTPVPASPPALAYDFDGDRLIPIIE